MTRRSFEASSGADVAAIARAQRRSPLHARDDRTAGRAGVSLVELVVVVVILGILAALAIPQLSRAAAPDTDAVLARNLKVLRLAIERYRQDHGVFPAQSGDGVNPAGSEAAFAAQLVRYTDAQGRTSDTQDSRYCFGPYLRDGIPPCPVPPDRQNVSVHVLTGPAPLTFRPETAGGWLYNCETGRIAPNTDAVDATGRGYASY